MCDGIVCHTVGVRIVRILHLKCERILRDGISILVGVIFIVGRDHIGICRQIVIVFNADDIVFCRADGLYHACAAKKRVFCNHFPGSVSKRRSGGKTGLAEHGVSQKEKNAQKKGKKKPAGFPAGGRFYRKICKCKPHMMCRSFLSSYLTTESAESK